VGALADLLGLLGFGGGLFGMGTYFTRGGLATWLKLVVVLPFALLVALGVLNVASRARTLLLGYLVIPVALAGLISLKMNVFYERYFSFVVPPYAILAAAGLTKLATCGRDGWRRAALIVVTTAVLVAGNVPALAAVYRGPWRYDWRAAAQYVEARGRPDDLIVYIPAYANLPFDYYFDGPQGRLRLTPYEILREANGVGRAGTMREAQVRALAERHPRMWIVATIPLGYEARMRFARLVAPYFTEVEGRDFGRVYVFLWRSRVYAARGGHR
jgi:hypothetical protein